MTVSTVLTGILPSFATAGIWAPVMLALLRFVQGISAGGEFPGAALFIGEYSQNNRRAFLTSFLSIAVMSAQLVALLVATLLVSTLSAEAMQSWGWRIPFLVALPMGAIGLYIRGRLEETPVFDNIEHEGAKSRSPLKAVVSNTAGWRMMGRATLFNLPVQVPGFLLMTFMPSYLTKSAGLSSGGALVCISIAVVVMIIVQPVAGLASDRFGRRPMLFACATVTLVSAYPAFALIQMGGYVLPTLGLILIAIVHGLGTGLR